MKKKPNDDFIDLGVINMEPTNSKTVNPSIKIPVHIILYEIGIYKLYPNVEIPTYATENSACFDVKAYLGPEVEKIQSYNRLLISTKKRVTFISELGKRGVHIEPGECLYIPTGFILDIPENYQVKYYPRSGISSQKHIKLANCVGIIDPDFINENMMLVFNDSENRQTIGHGDKIMQGEIVPVIRANFLELGIPPEQKTDRVGGFGHTRKVKNALVELKVGEK